MYWYTRTHYEGFHTETKTLYLPMRYVLCLFTCTYVYDVNLNPNEMPINFISIDFLLLSISGAKWKTVLHSIDNEKKTFKKKTEIDTHTHTQCVCERNREIERRRENVERENEKMFTVYPSNSLYLF